MGRQSHDATSTTTSTVSCASSGNGRMQRSQSRMSLSASFEALAVYFPCMNSFDEEEGGERDLDSWSLWSGEMERTYSYIKKKNS